MAMGDDAGFPVLPAKRSLRDVIEGTTLKRPETESAANGTEMPADPADEVLSLPVAGDPYQARSRAANRGIPTFHLLLADGSSRGFSYSSLDGIDLLPGKQPGEGPRLVLTIAGILPKSVVITGRKLEAIRDHLGFHRIAWLQELPPGRDFLADEAEVITNIDIGPLC